MTGTTRSSSDHSHLHKHKSSASAAADKIGYPHGHLGFLSGEEEEALRSFKVFLEEKGYFKSSPPSHDDQTLLRFLRARKWAIHDAFQQFKDTEDWRERNQLDVLYDTIDLEAYEQARGLYPQWTGRRDKRGIPLYVFEIRHLESKTIAAYEKSAADARDSKAETDGSTPTKLLRLFALYENLTRFVQPMCTQLPDRDSAGAPITLSTNIVDVTGVSLRMFWNLKNHMQAASQLATAHYPETLDRIFIIGAPYFFSTVWGWIKRWFDPVTVSKIFILSASEVLPTLQSFIDIKNIPKQYGGELEFDYPGRPNLDPFLLDRATWANGHTAFPVGPMYWLPVEGGKEVECIAVGRKDNVERRERVCTLPVVYPPAEEAKEEKPSAEVVVAPPAAADPAEASAEQPASTNGAPPSATEAEAGALPAAVQTLTIAEDEQSAPSEAKIEISEKIAASGATAEPTAAATEAKTAAPVSV